jgi:hypothetical protein
VLIYILDVFKYSDPPSVILLLSINMGSAVSVELEKPADASDIRGSNSLPVARNEVIRLRHALGHLAKDAGFAEVVYDASDLCLGEDEEEDFKRCCDEISYIRRALRLSTQSEKRRARVAVAPPTFFDEEPLGEIDDEDSDSDEEVTEAAVERPSV